MTAVLTRERRGRFDNTERPEGECHTKRSQRLQGGLYKTRNVGESHKLQKLGGRPWKRFSLMLVTWTLLLKSGLWDLGGGAGSPACCPGVSGDQGSTASFRPWTGLRMPLAHTGSPGPRAPSWPPEAEFFSIQDQISSASLNLLRVVGSEVSSVIKRERPSQLLFLSPSWSLFFFFYFF